MALQNRFRTFFSLVIFVLPILLFSCASVHSYLIDIKGGVYHRVHEDESLKIIAKAYGVSERQISITNQIEGNELEDGDLIFIPGATRLLQIEKKPAASPAGVGRRQRRAASSPVPPVNAGKRKEKISVDFIVPIAGNILSKFGYRDGKKHHGVDISAASGTPIHVIADGDVVYSDDELSDYGNMIIVKHQGNYTSVYAHNSKNLVSKGDKVKKGQEIATVGETGNATGPHLHFELRLGFESIDPEEVINFP